MATREIKLYEQSKDCPVPLLAVSKKLLLQGYPDEEARK